MYKTVLRDASNRASNSRFSSKELVLHLDRRNSGTRWPFEAHVKAKTPYQSPVLYSASRSELHDVREPQI